MRASLAGDAAAYRLLLNDLRRRLLAYLVRRLGAGAAEAEDLVQDILIAIHTKRATYDPDLPLTAWVYAIARHKLIDHYRRIGRRIVIPLEDAGALVAQDASAAAEARIDIDRALASLSPRTRDLIAAVKLREVSTADAAAQMKMTPSAVKVAVHRGLRRLTARMSGDPVDD